MPIEKALRRAYPLKRTPRMVVGLGVEGVEGARKLQGGERTLLCWSRVRENAVGRVEVLLSLPMFGLGGRWRAWW